jgi:hypothetical protein
MAMGVTVRLNPDVEVLVETLMGERGLSLDQAVNDAIRNGLAPRMRRDMAFPTHELGLPAIPGHESLQLAAELEDEEVLREMTRGT